MFRNKKKKMTKKRARCLSDCVHCHDSVTNDSIEEVIALTDRRLQPPIEFVSADDDDDDHNVDCDSGKDELQFFVDQFVIHDRRELCSLEDGRIEKGAEVYLCGSISKLIEAESEIENSISVRLIGPLNEWWFAGFDGGSRLLIGVRSEYANYLLRRPHDSYEPFFCKLHDRMFVTKCVIECLTENPCCDFDELLRTIEQKFIDFDQEHFLGSIPFIVRQLHDYDRFGDRDETRLCETSAFRTLLKLSGASMIANYQAQKDFHHFSNVDDSDKHSRLRYGQWRTRKNNFIKYVSTANSERIFASIYDDIIENLKHSHKPKKPMAAQNNAKNANRKMLLGQFVCFELRQALHYGRIIETDHDRGDRRWHINIFCAGDETHLGETSPARHLFATKQCRTEAMRADAFTMLQVRFESADSSHDFAQTHDSRLAFTVCFVFDQESCSFERFPDDYRTESGSSPICVACRAKKKLIPKLGSDDSQSKYVIYRDMTIRSGDCVTIDADQLDMPLNDYYTMSESSETEPRLSAIEDDDLYPERYRKSFSKNTNKCGYDNGDLDRCCHVVRIVEILPPKTPIISDDEDYGEKIRLSANIFYRPHHVFADYAQFLASDLNLIFYTDRIIEFEATAIQRKCRIIYAASRPPNHSDDLHCESLLFYFQQCFDPNSGQLYEPPNDVKANFSVQQNEIIDKSKCDQFTSPIRILDLFAGCGGLAYGFERTRNSCDMYAIESDSFAAQSFRRNFPSSKVLNGDANLLLNQLIHGDDHFIAQNLPPTGSFDIIIGGPPCQGFSEMNRFSSSEYSLFKSSMIACFLNYIEFYRPKLVLLENVRNLALHKRSQLLKIICSFLYRLGYQVRVTILQAGCYGVPQNRRRLFIFAASRGATLPAAPDPTHTFSQKHCDCSFVVDGKKFGAKRCKSNAPFRMMTIEDAIGDLPPILEHDTDRSRDPNDDFETDYYRKHLHFQRIFRDDVNATISNVMVDHCCKPLSRLNRERIARIPRIAGADWRDLPNIEIKLENGFCIRKLEYRFESDSQSGKRRRRRRGVCECAYSGIRCRALIAVDRQENTLIPWCLAHTADRRHHWAGLYGRLHWRGHFPTVVTRPDPISMQGTVIHPRQNRVLSVREYARAQTFPDRFTFCGGLDERYRQIGNAVPPILSAAIARRFIESYDLSGPRCVQVEELVITHYRQQKK